MKRLFALILSAVMLMGCMPAAQARTMEPMHIYWLLCSDVEELLGKEPMLSVVDQEMEGLLGAIVSEDDMMVLVFGPNLQNEPSFSLWSVADLNDTELMMLFANLLRRWDNHYLLEYNNPKMPVQISYVSARLESGSLTVSDAETAMLLLDALDSTSPAAPTPKPTARATARPTATPTATPRPSRPILPSIYSFADYRLLVKNSLDDYGQNYVLVQGFKSTAALERFVMDYITLLTGQYGFTLADTYEPSYRGLYYFLDYTGAGNIRPVTGLHGSGDVIIRMLTSEPIWIEITYSSSFDYLETDDRTTVNLR